MTLIEKFSQIIGDSYVLTGESTKRWAKDWTGNYPSSPGIVLRPGSTEEVAAIMRIATRERLSVTPISGNTGLVGGGQTSGGVMVSLDRLNKIDAINTDSRIARVGAGVILSALHDAAEEHDLIFPLIFGARGSAMIGGVLSTNAGGSNVLRYGNTRDLCMGVEVVLADGRIMNLMSEVHKDNSGFNLRDLFIGAEGQLGIITRAVLKLFPKPRAHVTAMLAVPHLSDALALLHRLNDLTDGAVQAFEYMPRTYVECHLDRVEGARAPFADMHDVNILVELGVTSEHLSTPDESGVIPVAAILESELSAMLDAGHLLDAVIAKNEAQRQEMWARREAAAEITFWRRPFVDSDIAVPLDKVSLFLERAGEKIAAFDPKADPFYIAHLGDGNVHYTVYVSEDSHKHIETVKELIEDVVQDLGGSFSAEHGVGLSKLGSMRRRKDPVALDMMRQIKHLFDPNGCLNPGKTIPE